MGFCVASLLIACEHEPAERDDVEWTFEDHGRYIDLSSTRAEAVCGGTLDYLDRHVEGLVERTGYEWPLGVRLHYRWLGEDFEEITGVEAELDGLAQGTDIYSKHIPHLHEVSHAFGYEVFGGVPPAFFDEGFAELFRSDLRYAPPDEAETSVRELLMHPHRRPPLQAYGLAGEFTRFLTDDYGFDDYVEFWRALPREASASDVQRSFRDHFGEDLDDSFDRFGQQPPCDEANGYRHRVADCLAPSIEWANDETWRVETELDCADDATIGPFFDRREQVFGVKIPREGLLELTGHGDPEVQIHLVRCDVDCSEKFVNYMAADRQVQREVQPGRYYVKFMTTAAVVASAGLSLSWAEVPRASN